MVSPLEARRRILSQRTHRIESLPILALSVHSACNCRCVMCDIWKANAEKREISADDLSRHVDAICRLRVQRVMLTGGEPLLHTNLWALCDRLHGAGIRVTLVTTGLLVGAHAAEVAQGVDELVVSIDGPAEVHDDIRRVRGAFDRIARGIALLNNHASRPGTTARSVVQRRNFTRLAATIDAVRAIGFERLSFLAADVTSAAFNRPEPWDDERRADVALSRDQVPLLAASIHDAEQRCRAAFDAGFVVGGIASLRRIHAYYDALSGGREFPPVRCNAPWISAVLEPGGRLRPCFFHDPYETGHDQPLDEALNSPAAVAFRRSLDVEANETCRRCVCALSLSAWADA
jgi:MoaA/NifB/PqqE/SkfB family radical SAM enzyme